jgi:NAD-dependent deacetylase
VWEWYDYRRGFIAAAQPNPGHMALAELEARTLKFTLITQNVDDLHERAGSRNVLHLHGSIWKLNCLQCFRQGIDMRSPLPELPPHCECGGIMRPGVVWFGEYLPQDVWRQAEIAARDAEVFLVVGTSSVVFPAAGLTQTAMASGAIVIEINPETTDVSSSVHAHLQGRSGEVLPQLIA